MSTKTKTVIVRVTPEDVQLLDTVAKLNGTSRSEVLRALVEPIRLALGFKNLDIIDMQATQSES